MTQNDMNMVNQMHFTAGNDYAFKKLFGTEENKDIMIEFVSLITGIRKGCFQYVAIENSELHPKFFDDILEIHCLDLTKVPESNLTAVEKWLMFIKTEDKEVRAMLAQKNPLLAKANKVMDSFYLNDEERVLYLAACKYESDRISMINESERKGIEKGRSEGFYQKALETAKNLIDMGLSVENIAKATGLSREEVEKL